MMRFIEDIHNQNNKGSVMINSKLMLLDKDSYTSSLLAGNLLKRGFKNIKTVVDVNHLPAAVAESRPDIVVFNYHFDEFDSLNLCTTLKQISPQSIVVAIVSPGPAFKTVESWSKQTKSIDLIVEKPLSDERFFLKLEDLVKAKIVSKASEKNARILGNLVPEAAINAIINNDDDAKMFEATVLFTDIRRSTELIRELPPREYFRLLNHLLSAQAKIIKQFEGSVIKYTGDGVMAIFKGAGRSYLAMRCALELTKSTQITKLSYGIGVADGLVLAGLIGDSLNEDQRQQYDVIGAAVHLASRLCGIANAGEVVTTKKLIAVASFSKNIVRAFAKQSIKGFNEEIECVAFGPLDRETDKGSNETKI